MNTWQKKTKKAGRAFVMLAALSMGLAWFSAKAEESSHDTTGKPDNGTGNSKKKPVLTNRQDADRMPGAFIQTGPVWIPVQMGAARPSYASIFLRLYPKEGQKGNACVAMPVIIDHLVRYFYPNPINPDLYNNSKEMEKLIRPQVETIVGNDMIDKLNVLNKIDEIDSDSAALSHLCN